MSKIQTIQVMRLRSCVNNQMIWKGHVRRIVLLSLTLFERKRKIIKMRWNRTLTPAVNVNRVELEGNKSNKTKTYAHFVCRSVLSAVFLNHWYNFASKNHLDLASRCLNFSLSPSPRIWIHFVLIIPTFYQLHFTPFQMININRCPSLSLSIIVCDCHSLRNACEQCYKYVWRPHPILYLALQQ